MRPHSDLGLSTREVHYKRGPQWLGVLLYYAGKLWCFRLEGKPICTKNWISLFPSVFEWETLTFTRRSSDRVEGLVFVWNDANFMPLQTYWNLSPVFCWPGGGRQSTNLYIANIISLSRVYWNLIVGIPRMRGLPQLASKSREISSLQHPSVSSQVSALAHSGRVIDAR